MPSVVIGGTTYQIPADDSVAQKVPSYNAAIQALAGIESGTGTAFPGSPATNDRFFRTDRGIEYFWNGTRWLSSQLFAETLRGIAGVQPYAATTAPGERMGALYAGTYDLWLERFDVTFNVIGGTALGASHKWVTELYKIVAAGSATLVATVNIDSGALSTWRFSTITINALLGTTNLSFSVNHTKTGTPGTLDTLPRLVYRLVG